MFEKFFQADGALRVVAELVDILAEPARVVGALVVLHRCCSPLAFGLRLNAWFPEPPKDSVLFRYPNEVFFNLCQAHAAERSSGIALLTVLGTSRYQYPYRVVGSSRE